MQPIPTQPTPSEPAPESEADALARAERNRRVAEARRLRRYTQRLRVMEPYLSDEDARVRYAEMRQRQEAFIAEQMEAHPEWDRTKAASRFNAMPGYHWPWNLHVTEEDGWCVLKNTWPFQRRLYDRYGVTLAFGEYRRLVKQAWVAAETPEQGRINYTKRPATVQLDNGTAIKIVLCGSLIFGLADETPDARIKVRVPKKAVVLAQSLKIKYGVQLDEAILASIRQQVSSPEAQPVLTLPYDRSIHRVEVGEHREVYILVRGGRPMEAKKAAGVRRGIAAQILEQRQQEAAQELPEAISEPTVASQPEPEAA